jgi:RecG-like helicase
VSQWDLTDGVVWGGRPVAHQIVDVAPRQQLVVTGTISGTESVTAGGAVSYRCHLDDGTGRISLVFLGRRRVPGLTVGTRCRVEGTVQDRRGRLELWNPLYRIEAPPPGVAPNAAVRR